MRDLAMWHTRGNLLWRLLRIKLPVPGELALDDGFYFAFGIVVLGKTKGSGVESDF